MNRSSHNYSFRNEEYGVTHRLAPTLNIADMTGCLIEEDWEILLPPSPSRLTEYYAYDLHRFFCRAFGLSLRLSFTDRCREYAHRPQHKIVLLTEADLSSARLQSEAAGAFHITVTEDAILIVGKSERGTAQGV